MPFWFRIPTILRQRPPTPHPANARNKDFPLWAHNCNETGVTGLTLTTAIPGTLEGLLAGTTLAKATPAAPANESAITPALPNGFADLLALLGVSAPTPEVSDTEAQPNIPTEAPSETPTAIVAAPPEQIATAIIRAMLKGSTPRPDVAPPKETAKELPLKTETPSEPVLTLSIPIPAPPPAVETAPEEKPEQPTLSEPTLTLAPEFVPQVQAPDPAIPVVVPPVELATPTPPIAAPVDQPRRIAAPTPNTPSAPAALRDLPRQIPQSTEIAPTAKQVPAAPVAFALRLTVAEELPTLPPRPEAPIKATPIEATKITPEAKPEEIAQPTVALTSSTNDAEQQEQAFTDQSFKDQAFEETPRPEKPAHIEARAIAPAPPPEPPPAPVAPTAPQRESVKLAPMLDAQPRMTDIAPVLQTEEAPKPSQAAHEIAVRVSAPDASPVDMHVTQRGSEVRVAVRTADEQMQSSLRQDLGKLVDRLEQTGFRAESLPVHESSPVHAERMNIEAGPAVFAVHGSAAIGSDSRSETSSQQDGRERDTDPNQSGSRQQQQQQRRQQRQPKQAWEDFA